MKERLVWPIRHSLSAYTLPLTCITTPRQQLDLALTTAQRDLDVGHPQWRFTEPNGGIMHGEMDRKIDPASSLPTNMTTSYEFRHSNFSKESSPGMICGKYYPEISVLWICNTSSINSVFLYSISRILCRLKFRSPLEVEHL
ncbi:hypothetical protein GALMADRAFT_605422 [Galerina marginata CBS 339.88]|uniref:Uncharacterized protein n=1 Tax=Galerina marginata (strain CBS 339.88) TaxID=685588 RepID=A0A067T2H6_GALM3|nr:hypothetical protein GALMADRAFT_605422 [Galerina marginata CBS 339.88]